MNEAKMGLLIVVLAVVGFMMLMSSCGEAPKKPKRKRVNRPTQDKLLDDVKRILEGETQ